MTPDVNGPASRLGVRLTVFARWWLLALCVALILGGWVLGPLDDTTLLSPDDGKALAACFAVAGVVAVASTAVGYTQSTGPLPRRVMAAGFCFGMIGALSTVLFTMPLARLALGRLTFPPDKTETVAALLPIGRAYRTRAYGTIQPTPLWANIDITKFDYDFMAVGGPTSDVRGEPDDVPSRGVFCARVTMQRSGDALRVLHAGTHTLPRGSVIRCPQAAAGQPYLEVR